MRTDQAPLKDPGATLEVASEVRSLPTFGRYKPMFRIAAGGMAEVYGARAQGEAGFQKWVALKRMLPHLSDDPRFVEMFLDEARIAANIHSPHVVSTLDLGRASDGSVFLVMDLVVGATLSTLLKSASRAGAEIPVAVALQILVQAALGLHDAHEARTPDGAPLEIVHRDVSPQNVLVGIDGRTRIMDFGVARASMRETHTRTGEIKGKLSYFSPEQASMAELDRRSDVFSLAVVTWEVLAMRRLFHAENPLAILSNLTSKPIPRLDELVPQRAGRRLADAVARGLERDPDVRTPSAAAFAEALLEAARDEVGLVSAERVGEVVRSFGGHIVDDIESAIRSAPRAAPRERRSAPTGERTGSIPPPRPTEETVDLSIDRQRLRRNDGSDGRAHRGSLPMEEPAVPPGGDAPTVAARSEARVTPSRRNRNVAVALAVVAALVGAGWLAGRATTPEPIRPDPPMPVVVAGDAPTVVEAPPADVPTEGVAPAEGPTIEPVAGASEDPPEAAGARRRRRATAPRTPSVAEEAPAATAHEPPPADGAARPTTGLRGIDRFERSIGL